MWMGLNWSAWLTLAIVLVMMGALILELARPDMIFLSAVGFLLGFGILTPEQAFAGFSNSAVITVSALFVVAVGVENTGALAFTDRFLFAHTTSLQGVLPRMMVTTATMSAFLNNTPIVAMLIPRVQAWGDSNDISNSKLLMPLSYAAILGGMTTLLGTSTNLLISGLMEASGYEPLGLFDLTWIGLPAALLVIIYFVLIGHRLLPQRSAGSDGGTDKQRYLFEVRLLKESALAGKTIEEAGLRALRELYLVHLYRGDEMLPSAPETRLQAGDVLAFLGNVLMLEKLIAQADFERVEPDLEPDSRMRLPLYEAVVASTSRLVGRTLRQADFRANFQGVVLGIQRADSPIEGPLANVPIRGGDLLLIEAPRGFHRRWNGRRSDFYLVAPRRESVAKVQKEKAPIALAILTGVILVAALNIAPIVVTAFVGALAMLATRCLRGWEARRAIDFSVLIVIAAALGLGQAIQSTGLASAIAHIIISTAAPFGPIGVLTAVYIATSIMTEFVTNNAAAALMLNIGLAAAHDLQVPPETFAIAIAIAASASFITPIGYQTNLMVMAAGGYRFSDYVRTGFPATIIVAVTALGLISFFWL
ncbi:SLC13 family permease [Anaerolineales bacterium HSG6]|nr:SLC13 family permease [Anaerolineales bacterium HSG6]